MKSIEIKTTQNVVLEYELADVKDRILAFVIDQIILVFGLLILFSMIVQGFGLAEFTGEVFGFVLFAVYLFYSLAMELLNHGQSIGKMSLRIRVIKTTGSRAVFSDYAARWTFRLIDIFFSFGGIASILIASSGKAQRIGDVVASTTVIKLVPKNKLRLQELMSIQSQDTYQPSYGQAKHLSEEDVLLIKATLDRHRQFGNTAHKEALDMLADRIIEVLGIQEVTQRDRRQFLQAILKDYVVLTR